MKVFAISDLHLSFTSDKPMDVFGGVWEGHHEQIRKDWNERVTDEDVVIVAGDISWAMTIENARIDLAFLDTLNGKKVIVKGNHDYWWSSLKKVNDVVPKNVFCLQNNAFKIGSFVFSGTRGWMIAERGKELEVKDKKIHDRELIRLQLSLDEAKKLMTEGDKLLVVMHYPPFNTLAMDSEFTMRIEDAGVRKVVYGHLHGKRKGLRMVWDKNAVTYYLTSCDLLENKLVELY